MGSTWSCKRGRELPWLQPRLFYAHASTSTFLVKILFLCPLLPVCVCFSCLRQGQFQKEEEEEDKTAAEAASAHFCSRTHLDRTLAIFDLAYVLILIYSGIQPQGTTNRHLLSG